VLTALSFFRSTVLESAVRSAYETAVASCWHNLLSSAGVWQRPRILPQANLPNNLYGHSLLGAAPPKAAPSGRVSRAVSDNLRAVSGLCICL
jgi:hypothetical protein